MPGTEKGLWNAALTPRPGLFQFDAQIHHLGNQFLLTSQYSYTLCCLNPHQSRDSSSMPFLLLSLRLPSWICPLSRSDSVCQ